MSEIKTAIIPHYEFEERPNIAFGFKFSDDMKQQRLTCGHWCSTFYRHCPHCGALIVHKDEVNDYIAERAIAKFKYQDAMDEARRHADIFDFDGAVTVNDALDIQDALDYLTTVYNRVSKRMGFTADNPQGSDWVRDGLTEEEWQRKPLDQRLYEIIEHAAWIMVEIDPAGTLRVKEVDA